MRTPNPTLAALLALLFVTPAFAELYRIEIEGVTTSFSTGSGSWGDDVAIGTPVTLALTVDSAAGVPWDISSRVFEGVDGLLSVGSFQMQMATSFYVYDNDPINGDVFAIEEMPPTIQNRFSYSGFSARLGSSDPSLLSDTTAPTHTVDMGEFDTRWLNIWGATDETFGTPTVSRLNATIIGYSVTAIPEPATTALWMGAAAIAALLIRQKDSASF